MLWFHIGWEDAAKKTISKLQRVLNAVAQIVSNTRKYDWGLRQLQQQDLHWLDVDDWVWFRVCVQVYKCLHNMAPGYLSALCQPVSRVPGRCHLRSAGRGELDFPRVSLYTCEGWAFAYAGPTCWNLVPDNLKNINLLFKLLNVILRHSSFPYTSTFSAFEVFL